jgi:PAS domain S-box-containing protein
MQSLKRKYRSIITLSATAVIIYCAYVLFYSWGLGRGIFDERISGPVPMASDSALCFVLISISLLLKIFRKKRTPVIASQILLIPVSIWSALLLIRDFTPLRITFIFGMSPQTALCFFCLAIALYLIRSRYKPAVQGLLHLVTLISSIVIIGHILNIPEFYKMTFIPMAVYAAFAFFMLSVSASLVNYNSGITALFTGNLMGNLMARRLFLNMVIATLVVGYIRIQAYREEWLSVELGSALLIITFIMISLILIWITSRKLNNVHMRRMMAEENFRTAVEAAPYALIIVDSEGNITMVNDRTRALYRFRKSELLGNNLRLLIPERFYSNLDEILKSFFHSPSVIKFGAREDAIARRKDGSEFPIEATLTPVKTSGNTFMLITIIDITERKRQEEIIRNQVIELQQKNEELEQFNYISSHDLQEPLRTVSNYVGLIQEDYPDTDPEVKQHITAIGAAASRMSMVVRSLLEFGKLGRKKKLVLTNCTTVLKNVIADLDSLIKSNNATITLNCDIPELYAYETELRQLFQNLINNAIKFRKPDTPPHIRIKCRKHDEYYKFSVSDNGIGINREHFPKIFHIFHRIHSEEAYEGHGIGLANCKKIAEMHGGSIWLESTPGKGSTFKFTILNFRG